MRNKFVMTVLGVGMLAIVPGTTFARAAKAPADKSAEVRTLTGCLTHENGHEYLLTTEDGATWEVKSNNLKLSPHAGHTVTLTGKVRNADLHGAKEKMKDEMKEHGVDKNEKEHGHLRATSLKMVSESCKR